MTAPHYPKIETLYNRDENFKVKVGELRRPEFAIPRHWVVTEKIDGTNCRISLERLSDLEKPVEEDESCLDISRWVIKFRGRTENSQMPTFLLEYLQRTFTVEKMQSLWRCKTSCNKCDGHGLIPGKLGGFTCENFEPYQITLYGEGYGAKIQKGGGNYRRDGDVSFRLFDVFIGRTWLDHTNVENVAQQLGIKTVPCLGYDFETTEIVLFVKSGIESVIAHDEGMPGTMAEGVVAFTNPPLFNGRGDRLIWKLKSGDF